MKVQFATTYPFLLTCIYLSKGLDLAGPCSLSFLNKDDVLLKMILLSIFETAGPSAVPPSPRDGGRS